MDRSIYTSRSPYTTSIPLIGYPHAAYILSILSVRFLDVSPDVQVGDGQVSLSPVAFAGISRSFRPTLPAEECLPKCPVPEKRITSVESIRPEPGGPLPTTPSGESDT